MRLSLYAVSRHLLPGSLTRGKVALRGIRNGEGHVVLQPGNLVQRRRLRPRSWCLMAKTSPGTPVVIIYGDISLDCAQLCKGCENLNSSVISITSLLRLSLQNYGRV